MTLCKFPVLARWSLSSTTKPRALTLIHSSCSSTWTPSSSDLRLRDGDKNKFVRYRRGNLGTLCLVAKKVTIVKTVPKDATNKQAKDARKYGPLEVSGSDAHMLVIALSRLVLTFYFPKLPFVHLFIYSFIVKEI